MTLEVPSKLLYSVSLYYLHKFFCGLLTTPLGKKRGWVGVGHITHGTSVVIPKLTYILSVRSSSESTDSWRTL